MSRDFFWQGPSLSVKRVLTTRPFRHEYPFPCDCVKRILLTTSFPVFLSRELSCQGTLCQENWHHRRPSPVFRIVRIASLRTWAFHLSVKSVVITEGFLAQVGQIPFRNPSLHPFYMALSQTLFFLNLWLTEICRLLYWVMRMRGMSGWVFDPLGAR